MRGAQLSCSQSWHSAQVWQLVGRGSQQLVAAGLGGQVEERGPQASVSVYTHLLSIPMHERA